MLLVKSNGHQNCGMPVSASHDCLECELRQHAIAWGVGRVGGNCEILLSSNKWTLDGIH